MTHGLWPGYGYVIKVVVCALHTANIYLFKYSFIHAVTYFFIHSFTH